MSPDLDHWHARLASHFEALAARRHSGSGTPPVFALEHGLDDTEIELLSRKVRTYIRSRTPSWEHRLPWIVYAAECGYGYSGNEYWQTFEAETPGWKARGDRYWIRKCYHWFQRTYGGAKPSGQWAGHFTIICWPITHAVLPKDLQRQLARVLYEIRSSFSQAVFTDPSTLGQLVATRSWTASERFQHFVQERQLVGQIAAALLLEGESGTDSLLDAPTLGRISRDLDKERRGREWLRAARYSARERARVRGLAREPSRKTRPRRTEEARAEVAALGIEPRLVLRPVDVEGLSWSVSIEIPDLSSLGRRFPDTQPVLTQSRCRVAGYEGRPIARGRFLYGAQRLTLSRWPAPQEVFLQFEQSHPDLEFLLKAECLLRPGPPWLFRIASDGLAYECRGLRVRPGQRYVVLATQVSAFADVVSPVDIECRGIRGTLLQLPSAVGSRLENMIRDLGLTQARLIEVWPAGLAPAYWDGEGHSEWLAGDRPTLGIQSDHALGMIRVSLDGQPNSTLELTRVTPGEPIFVQMPPLPVGLHTMRVAAAVVGDTNTENLGHLNVAMSVREASPWHHGVDPSGPLSVRVDPVIPTLEKLWDGQIDIEVLGPPGRAVKCDVSLLHRGKEKPAARIVRRLELPITPNKWRHHFENNVRTKKEVQRRYDAAYACRLHFDADELGTFELLCEREFTPLRWALVGKRNRKPVVQLIDDSGSAEIPRVFHYALDKPAAEVSLDFAWEYKVSAPGGLYLASQGSFSAGIIAVLRRYQSFGDLTSSPVIPSQTRSLATVLEAVELGYRWASARSSGDILSVTSRRKALQVIIRHVVGLIGGEVWAKAEADFEEEGARDLTDLVRAVTRHSGQRPFASTLAREAAVLAQAPTRERVSRFAKLTGQYGVLRKREDDRSVFHDPAWMAELSLRLASNPRDAVTWAAGDRQTAVRRLMEVPILARAARFVVLATHNCSDAPPTPDEAYAGWTWT